MQYRRKYSKITHFSFKQEKPENLNFNSNLKEKNDVVN